VTIDFVGEDRARHSLRCRTHVVLWIRHGVVRCALGYKRVPQEYVQRTSDYLGPTFERDGLTRPTRSNRPSSIAFPIKKTPKVDGPTSSTLMLGAAMSRAAHIKHAKGVGQTGFQAPTVRRSHNARKRACSTSCIVRTSDSARPTVQASGRDVTSGFQR
jgi:hypothetical protein